MRALILLVALLAFGCDDVGVRAAVDDVLDFGGVSAYMVCAGITIDSVPSDYAVHQFVDGARFVSLRRGQNVSLSRLCARDEACAGDALIAQDPGVRIVHIVGSDVEVEHLVNGVENAFDITTFCTGRNLGAF